MVRRLQWKASTTDFLLVHHEPAECKFIAEQLRERVGAAVESVFTMSDGIRLIAGKRFDLALIQVVLPDLAGVELATMAANQNTPALLLADNSPSTDHARRLGYPCLEKPFDVDRLVAESIAIVGKARLVVREVVASTDKMDCVIRSLTAEVAEAHRLFDLIMSRLGRKRD